MHQTGMQGIGARVRALRLAASAVNGGRISQVDLGRMTGLGQQVVSFIETGRQKTIAPEQLQALADALHEDPYYLFTGKRSHALGPVAGRVHEIESRVELDWYARDAIVAVAEREAQRVRDQQRDSEGVMARLLEAGFDREAAARAIQAMRETDGASDVA